MSKSSRLSNKSSRRFSPKGYARNRRLKKKYRKASLRKYRRRSCLKRSYRKRNSPKGCTRRTRAKR